MLLLPTAVFNVDRTTIKNLNSVSKEIIIHISVENSTDVLLLEKPEISERTMTSLSFLSLGVSHKKNIVLCMICHKIFPGCQV